MKFHGRKIFSASISYRADGTVNFVGSDISAPDQK